MADAVDTTLTTYINNLQVTTILHFSEAVMKRYDNMVYLYDPSWIGTTSPDDIDTLPFVALEVIKEDINQNCAVSKKRIILFDNEERNATQEKRYKQSVVNVIADNVVNEPIIHKLECLLPRESISNMISDTSSYGRITSEYIMSLIGVDAVKTALEIVRNFFAVVNLSAEFVKRIENLMKKLEKGSNDYNRRSLLSMARRRAVIVYKSWSSWETKSVVISNVNISKVGLDGDYYRCQIELQEMPILYIGNINPEALYKTATDSQNASVVVSEKIKGMFESIIRRREY